MAEWHDKVAEQFEKLEKEEKQQPKFDLMQELARGAIYRGGESQENFLTGYTWGIILFVGMLVFFYVLGVLKGH